MAAGKRKTKAGRKKKPVKQRRGGSGRRVDPALLRRLIRVGLRLSVFVALAALLWGFSLSQDIIARFEGERFRLPSRVYSDAAVLAPDLSIEAFGLRDRLRRLGYDPVRARPPGTGQYWESDSRIEIGLRAFSYPGGREPARRVVLEIRDGRIFDASASDGSSPPFALEPELVGGLFRGIWEERDIVHLDQVPDELIDALLAVEDSRFLTHPGVDPIAIGRALWVDLRTGSFAQGGSTLTQQLVKNLFLTHERTISRKIREAAMALVLDALYSKEEILETYLNAIYLGQRGTMGIYGVGEASRYYFGRSVSQLDLAECALLAGMIQSPGRYDPFRHRDAARDRRDIVLKRMVDTGRIDARRADLARARDVPDRAPPGPPPGAPYFVDRLRDELRDGYSDATLTGGGLRVFTTLDPVLQQRAAESVEAGLEVLERLAAVKAREDASPLEAALIELDPETGSVRALVGGRSYATSPFNRATQARRPAGSLLKPFLYARALDGATGVPMTLASIVVDEPYEVVYDGKTWSPQNFEREFHGPVTLHRALVDSINVPAARVGEAMGFGELARALGELGFAGDIPAVPALSLGAVEVSPLEVARAYGAFPSEGLRVEPTTVRNVVDGSGAVLTRRAPRAVRVMSADTAYLLTHTLQEVVNVGTARRARVLGLDRPAAGKTGTTDDFRDAWFAGYLPGRVVIVWVGRDRNEPIGKGMTGAHAALPIWVRYVTSTSWWPEEDFLAPPDVLLEEVDAHTGELATMSCTETLVLPFVDGSEPGESCHEHPTLVERLRDGIGLGSEERGAPEAERPADEPPRDDDWKWLRDLL